MRNVTLILDDGSRFHGKSFGFEKPVAGEVVFNTAMTGYPESLSNHSETKLKPREYVRGVLLSYAFLISPGNLFLPI